MPTIEEIHAKYDREQKNARIRYFAAARARELIEIACEAIEAGNHPAYGNPLRFIRVSIEKMNYLADDAAKLHEVESK